MLSTNKLKLTPKTKNASPRTCPPETTKTSGAVQQAKERLALERQAHLRAIHVELDALERQAHARAVASTLPTRRAMLRLVKGGGT